MFKLCSENLLINENDDDDDDDNDDDQTFDESN